MLRQLTSSLRVTWRDFRTHGRLWIPLGLTSTGTAAAITILSVFLPVVLAKFTDSGTLIGFAIGGEGLFALALSILIGPLSDRTHTRFGRRRPYILAGVILAAACLTLAPLMPSYWSVVGVIFGFFIGYYLIGTPYRALAPDVLAPEHYGRALGYQQLLRGVGFIIAFSVGSAIFPWNQFLPFAIVAGVLLFSGLTTVLLVREPATAKPPLTFRREFRELWRAWRGHAELRKAVLANFLFEASFAGLRTFVVLFFLVGMKLPIYWVTIAVGIVAIANVVGSVIIGYLADSFGIRRVLFWSNLLYAAFLVVPFFWQKLWFVFALLPPLALVGVGIITLSFPLVMEIIPSGRRGGYSGIFELARGLGIVVGPVATGAAIDLYRHLGGPYEGYPAMWLALSVMSFLAVLVLRWLGPEPDHGQRRKVEAGYAKATRAA